MALKRVGTASPPRDLEMKRLAGGKSKGAATSHSASHRLPSGPSARLVPEPDRLSNHDQLRMRRPARGNGEDARCASEAVS